ncbi:MAG TPA: MmcQ/YjbR family DNA-binding protein [Planctomycetota bacterium]
MSGNQFPNHPVLQKLRRLSATLPESCEIETWEHPTFRAGKKIYAIFGDHEGTAAVSIKQTLAQQPAWLAKKGFYAPPYVAHKGWVGIRVEQVDWPTIAKLAIDGYRQVALKRMLKQLDDA